MMRRRQQRKKSAVKEKAREVPSSNQALSENGMLQSMKTRDHSAVKVTVAMSWYFSRRYWGIRYFFIARYYHANIIISPHIRSIRLQIIIGAAYSVK